MTAKKTISKKISEVNSTPRYTTQSAAVSDSLVKKVSSLDLNLNTIDSQLVTLQQQLSSLRQQLYPVLRGIDCDSSQNETEEDLGQAPAINRLLSIQSQIQSMTSQIMVIKEYLIT